MILSNNRISTLRSGDAIARTSQLTNLRHLDLTNNLIKTWSDIAALDELPALESLNVAGNPLLVEKDDEKGSTNRLQLIGRIARIIRLERTPVSSRRLSVLPDYSGADISVAAQIRSIERNDGERFYLAMIAKDSKLQTEGQRAAAHPRYLELIRSQCGSEVRRIQG